MAVLPEGSYPTYFENYINQVDAKTVAEATEKYAAVIEDFFQNIPAGKADYKYAEGKWSLKELLLHLTDTERIFAYRVLRISRNDKTPLAGFDENNFVEFSNAGNRTWNSILEEFVAVRKATDLLLGSLTDEQLGYSGTTNGSNVIAAAIGFIIYGHILHHINIIKERYL